MTTFVKYHISPVDKTPVDKTPVDKSAVDKPIVDKTAVDKIVDISKLLITDVYPNIGIIKSFTGKDLICRLDFSKTTVNDLLVNLCRKINYRLQCHETKNINFLHKNNIFLSKDKTLKELGCNNIFEKLSMTLENKNNGINHKPSSELLQKCKFSKKVVFIKTLTGKTIPIPFHDEMTVVDIKYFIMISDNIPINLQRLVYNGRQLDNNNYANHYNIENKDTIHINLRLCGGMFHETSGRNGGYNTLSECIIDIDPLTVNVNKKY